MSHPVKIAASTLTAIALLFAGLSVAQAGHEHGFFNIIVKANIDDDPAPKLQDPRLVAEFNYVRELDTPTLDAPAGWIDGDRQSYDARMASSSTGAGSWVGPPTPTSTLRGMAMSP